MAQYGRPEFWEEWYMRTKKPFDWYQRWPGVRDVLTQYLSPTDQILNIGAGDSYMSEDMFAEGYVNITNIDISPTVVRTMLERYQELGPTMKYLQMDARKLEFPDGSFDAVVDKGMLDSILCGDRSTANANKMLTEVHRVLNINGVYMSVSYGAPERRMMYLNQPAFTWTVESRRVAKPTVSAMLPLKPDERAPPQVHFVYICKKVAS